MKTFVFVSFEDRMCYFSDSFLCFSDSFQQFNRFFSLLEEHSLCEQYNFTSTEPEQDQLDDARETKKKNWKRVIVREDNDDSDAGSSPLKRSTYLVLIQSLHEQTGY